MEKDKLDKILAQMPPNPGIYIMKNRVGEIIYIGKSRSLKKRVKSYFNRVHDSLKTSVLVSAIEDIEFIITNTEVEALILENNLIKKHHPRYNILLKDSRTHPYIRVTMKERFPRLEKVRKVSFRDGNLYFGPFPNEYDLTRIIDLLSRNFRLCTSKKTFASPTENKKVRPCLKYHLGVCQGVCQGEVTPEEYAVSITKAVDVLSGRVQPDFSGLEQQLKYFADHFRFEEAAEMRDTLTALKRFFESQKVEFVKPFNLDFWGMSEANDRLIFSVFFVRGGKMLGNRILDIEREPDSSNSEVLATVMSRFYDINLIPSVIYCSIEPEGVASVLEMLSERAGRKVAFHIPRKGQFLSLLSMADNNALEILRNLKSEGHERMDESVIDLQNLLELGIAPVRIECVDISHIQGTDPVASLVVCHNGRPKKGEYRLYHIKSAQGGNDPASIAEVTRRRFSRLLREHAPLPDLYIVDGGITQVRAACHELEQLAIEIEVLGLAKREETLVKRDGSEINLPFSSPGMKSIIKLRNEAHRFANTFQKKTHNRRVLRSALLNLPGVGPATLRKALWEFGSMANVAMASAEELRQRCQIPLKTAEIIIASLKEGAPMKKLRRILLLLMILTVGLTGDSPAKLAELEKPLTEIDKLALESAFMKVFNEPEEFKASGIFQLLGYDAAEIAQIGKITPRPASITVEIDPAAGEGAYKSLKVYCYKVFYYNLTIERVMFDFPECSINKDELKAGRLRFETGERIDLKTEVSSADIIKVFELYARAKSLSGMKMKLEKDCAKLNGRVKKGFVTAEFALKGNTQLLDPKTVNFRCKRLTLNGMPMPRNAISSIFKYINPVFDAKRTWLNLNVASIAIKPGFVETHATINRKKG